MIWWVEFTYEPKEDDYGYTYGRGEGFAGTVGNLGVCLREKIY